MFEIRLVFFEILNLMPSNHVFYKEILTSRNSEDGKNGVCYMIRSLESMKTKESVNHFTRKLRNDTGAPSQ